MWQTDESQVREAIKDFSERGWTRCALTSGAGSSRLTEAERKRIVAVAGVRLETVGVP